MASFSDGIMVVFLFLSTICFFYSISVISLAKALTLAFVSPIFVTILSAFLLKEKVGFHRWFAVFVGYCTFLAKATKNPKEGLRAGQLSI